MVGGSHWASEWCGLPTATFAWRRAGCLAGAALRARRLYLLITRFEFALTRRFWQFLIHEVRRTDEPEAAGQAHLNRDRSFLQAASSPAPGKSLLARAIQANQLHYLGSYAPRP